MVKKREIVLTDPNKFLMARFRCERCGNRYNLNPDKLTTTCTRCKHSFDIRPAFDMYAYFVPHIQELLEKKNDLPISAPDRYLENLKEFQQRYKLLKCFDVGDIKRVKKTIARRYCNECGFCDDCMTCKECKKDFKFEPDRTICPYCNSKYITKTYTKDILKCSKCGSITIRPTVFKHTDKCPICTTTNIRKIVINANRFEIKRFKMFRIPEVKK